MNRLPPYGKRFQSHPDRTILGAFVYAGARAWDVASDSAAPCMLLPEGIPPHHFRWPVSNLMATVLCCGQVTDQTLIELGRELLRAGAITVFAVSDDQSLTVMGAS